MKKETVYYIFVFILTGVIGLTLQNGMLLRVSAFLALLFAFSLIGMLISMATIRVKTGSCNVKIRRGESAYIPVQIRYVSLFHLKDIFLYTDSGLREHFTGSPFITYGGRLGGVFQHVEVHEASSATVELVDFMSLFRFRKKIPFKAVKVAVLPFSFPAELPDLRKADSGKRATVSQEDSTLPSGLRTWQDGDSLKKVHWKLTMKSYVPGDARFLPVVKTYEESAKPDMLVIPYMNHETEEAHFRDTVCDITLSLCKSAVREGQGAKLLVCSDIVTETEAYTEEDISNIALTLAEHTHDTQVPFDIHVTEVMRRVETTGAAVFVLAQLTPYVMDKILRLMRYSALSVELRMPKESFEEAQEWTARLSAAGIKVRAEGYSTEAAE